MTDVERVRELEKERDVLKEKVSGYEKSFQNMLADLNHQVDLKRAAQKERDILKARIGRVTHFVKEFMEEGGA